jgi:phage terminase large subunit-like protein
VPNKSLKKQCSNKKVSLTFKDELVAYCNEQSIRCQKHKWACERFLDDLKRADSDDPEFPYEFDEKRALQFIEWCRLFKHRKGVLQGKFIEPTPIQRFIFGNLYGWVNIRTGYRRFTKCYWQVGRKNAKSQSAALIALYETMVFLSERKEISETYIAATKREQAAIVYDEAVNMLRGCSYLKGHYKIAYGKIRHAKTGSILRSLSEEDRKTGDGLNPQCSIIDEYHAHETSEILDIVQSGMGARQQPLTVIITTAGFDLEHPCYRVEYDLVSKLLNPNIDFTLENYFAMVNELDKNNELEDIRIGDRIVHPGELIDDINDKNVWIKANPIRCSYEEGVDFIQKELAEAREAPEKMRNFLTKHMDIWVNQREFSYMNMDHWKICAGEFPELHGKEVYVGCDLASKDDLTSVGFEFFIDDKYFIKQHSFLPEIALQEKMNKDRRNPWKTWVDQGKITIISGAAADYRVIKKWMIEEIENNAWVPKAIGIDPWNASQLLGEMIEEYGEKIAIEIRQGTQTLSEPTKDFRALVKGRRIVHENDPVLNFAVSNAVVHIDHNGNIKLDKEKSKEKIDPLAAVINAHCRAMLQKNEESVYETRGLRSLV